MAGTGETSETGGTSGTWDKWDKWDRWDGERIVNWASPNYLLSLLANL